MLLSSFLKKRVWSHYSAFYRLKNAPNDALKTTLIQAKSHLKMFIFIKF